MERKTIRYFIGCVLFVLYTIAVPLETYPYSQYSCSDNDPGSVSFTVSKSEGKTLTYTFTDTSTCSGCFDESSAWTLKNENGYSESLNNTVNGSKEKLFTNEGEYSMTLKKSYSFYIADTNGDDFQCRSSQSATEKITITNYPVYLSVYKQGAPGGGYYTITPTPEEETLGTGYDKYMYANGTSVTLTAVAGEGNVFSEWKVYDRSSGTTEYSKENPITITLGNIKPTYLYGNASYAVSHDVYAYFVYPSGSTPTPTSTSTPTPIPTQTSTSTPTPIPTPANKVIENRRTKEQLEIGDPVDAGSGAFHFTMPMLDLGGPMGLNFTLSYRSDNENWQERTPNDFPGSPSRFWWSPLCRLYIGDSERLFWTEDGSMVSFNADGSLNETATGSNPNNGQPVRYVMKDSSDYVYIMSPVNEYVYIFQKGGEDTAKGRILYIIDRNSNYLKYTYGNDEDNNPSKIEDNTGRSLNLSYSNHGSASEEAWFLDAVTDQEDRGFSFTYEKNASDNGNEWTLLSVTDVMGASTIFQYTAVSYDNETHAHNITEVQYPEGNTPYANVYTVVKTGNESAARVTSQTDAYGNTTEITYKQDKSGAIKTTAQYPDGGKDVYQHNGSHSPPKGFTDAAGNKASFGKNDAEQITSLTDRMGDTTSFTYHENSGKPASTTNAKGDTTSHAYTAQEQTVTNPANLENKAFTFYNRTKTNYPDGTSEQFEFDAKGNINSMTDRSGNVWQYEYNSMGQLTKTTNPAGGATDNTYNTDATLASSKNSDTGTTTYEYDTYKRLTKIIHPDGASTQMSYDLADRLTSAADENGNMFTYTYDENGNRTKATDSKGGNIQYAYDLMDRVTKVTDQSGKTTTTSYDSMGNVASAIDPTGVTTEYDYDERQWLNKTTIEGNTWQTEHDDEGIVSSQKTPLGYTTTIETDNLGQTVALKSPLDYTTSFTRDSMSRITEETNPLGNTTAYTYDNRGLLTGVAEPEEVTSVYEYNELGLLSKITDPNGNNWLFSHTSMGRPKSQTDPLGNALQFSHDTRGRLAATTYPDGGTQTATYDSAGNVTRQLYSDGVDLQYAYDSLNLITSANNIQFTYDAKGQITDTADGSISFGATYDDAGRLKTASYANDAFAVTYTYSSKTGLLTKATDNLTNTQIEFTYDKDLRLTNIKRSNGVNTTFTWDKSSRLTRIRDGSIIDLQYTLDAIGQIRKAKMQVPLDPSDVLPEEGGVYDYDAACQLSADNYAYDKRGRLATSPDNSFEWDDASRLVNTGYASLAYNGMGDLRTRSDDESETQYYYNYAIEMTPIVAEQDVASRQFMRYYVWAPGGQLLYLIDAQNGNKVYFYHFDNIGSTLALTDKDGQVTDAYAYTPYGELLEQSGDSKQPFTFVGQLGVRRETSGYDLYHMRARYYDAQTARFISRDPLWPNVSKAHEVNPYQYAYGDPVSLNDPTGERPDEYGGGALRWNGEGVTQDQYIRYSERVKEEERIRKSLAKLPSTWTLGDLAGNIFQGTRPLVGKESGFVGGLIEKTGLTGWLQGALGLSEGAVATLSKVNAGAAAVWGAYEIYEFGYVATSASAHEVSQMAGDNANSSNPLTQAGVAIGNFVANNTVSYEYDPDKNKKALERNTRYQASLKWR